MHQSPVRCGYPHGDPGRGFAWAVDARDQWELDYRLNLVGAELRMTAGARTGVMSGSGRGLPAAG